MRPSLIASLLSFSLAAGISACVTVNVTFPESAVQQASDDFVNDLYETKGRTKVAKPAPASEEPKAGEKAPEKAEEKPTSFLHGLLISEAFAEFSVHADTPKAKAIKDKIREKVPEIKAKKKAGLIGEAKNGYLKVRGDEALQPIEKKKLEAFVDEENDLRKDLYKEVLKANHMGRSDLAKVEESFSRSFQRVSPSGTWIEDAKGNWTKKD